VSLLRLNNLCVHYGPIVGIKDISLEVHSGEIVALLGANGAGKTTTLQCISGLLKQKKGEIVFKGTPIQNLPTHTRVQMGLSQSPEGRMVFPHMTVKENLILGAFTQKSKYLCHDMEKVFHLFPRLEERIHHMASLLSGGEQQMLAIGRALMARSELLLLDEPSLGISPLLMASIFQKLKELNTNDGLTLLIAEQNAHSILKMAHRGYVLENGEVIKTAPASDLLHDPVIKEAYLGGISH
jgi:branched-chain amino acid transport system ATP-binding protein